MRLQPPSTPQIEGKVRVVGLDRAVAELAGAQHGVVARRQLIGLGLSAKTIEGRLKGGRLLRVHHGVYALGHRRLSTEGRLWAAVLAAGPGAVLSHRSAAHVWAVRRSSGPLIEVIAPYPRRAGRGVRVREGRLAADEVTTHDGLPVTTVSRTLLDLAAVLSRQSLERAIQEAERRRLGDAVGLRRAPHTPPAPARDRHVALDPRRRAARREPHPQPARAPLPRLRRSRRPAAPGRQRLDGAPPRPMDRERLRVASAAADRRARRARAITTRVAPSSPTVRATSPCRPPAGGSSGSPRRALKQDPAPLAADLRRLLGEPAA